MVRGRFFYKAGAFMAPIQASDEKARDILLQSKQATGGEAWNTIHALSLRYSIIQGGLDGALEQWHDTMTGHYSQSHHLGITAGGEGFDGLLPWSQDVSGCCRLEDNGDAREAAVNHAYRACLGWWYPERFPATLEYRKHFEDSGMSCHILRITPRSGRRFEVWIDAVTFLVERTVEQGAFETVTQFFSEYRSVAGVKLAFHVRVSNGETQYDQQREVQQIELNPPDFEAHLKMPPSPPLDFQIADNQNSVELPFQLAANLILVDVAINGGKTLPFVLDTGGVNLVTPEAALELGLEAQGAFWGFGGGEKTVEMKVAAVTSLEFGNIRLSDRVIWVFPFPELKEALGIAEFGGLLGYEVFRRFVVRVDYQSQILTFIRPDHFSYEGSGTIVPFRFNSNIPEVEGSIDGVAGKFDFDTGFTGTVLLHTPFVERNQLVHKYQAGSVDTKEGAGGGAVSFLAAQSQRLRLGELEVLDLPIALSLQRSGALSNPYAAGLVGAEIFRQFVMIFDYSRQQIIFEKPVASDASASLAA